MIKSLCVTVSLLAVGIQAAVDIQKACQKSTFESVLDDKSTIERVDVVNKGDEYGEGKSNVAYPRHPTDLPELCAVTVKVESSATTSYRFGLFLPTEWNSKRLTVGNGGFAGGINWLDMAPGAKHGFATASTDTGHSSNATDASWALNDEESRIDWGWRALHGTVGRSKELVEAYYSDAPGFSYYSGCSTGGRQGLRELQGFPDSFDGAIIGAAAWNPPQLNSYLLQLGLSNLPADDPKHIDIDKVKAIAGEVVKQCDGLDGVEDGIISSPELCDVDLEAISCDKDGVDPAKCLTEPQMDTVRKAYEDFYVDGKFSWSGFNPGSEAQLPLVLGADIPSGYGIQFQTYFVHNDPKWSWRDFNNGMITTAVAKNPGKTRADRYNLADFKSRGGKIIMYHGTADGLVPTRGSEVYYNRVSDAMGGPPTDFFRYFPVPGMQHCWTTAVDAPWHFGAPFQAGAIGNDTWSVPGFNDAKHDVLLALVDWVEEGKPVDSLIATTWKVANDSDSGLLRQRPLCPHPEKAIYDGKGDVNKAESWACGIVNAEEEDDGVSRRPAAVIVSLCAAIAISFLAF
ncbi:related to feruloyl esterase B precursor [Cephalotrichum gorgonifer]|uniref:Carboxylic ester hydrolase n=1 Tax=Cephalotrichum gorgonifer TaxID=2041049 RepID=A0AAE8MSG5_9PEZI|nr:related to feruloyl esterase B precursor [Cephalotrichum gorgonifer]